MKPRFNYFPFLTKGMRLFPFLFELFKKVIPLPISYIQSWLFIAEFLIKYKLVCALHVR